MSIFIRKEVKPFGIVILDGWGLAPNWGGNAIARAKTKNFNKLMLDFPSTSLLASGTAVGLPVNSPGNSEAGHLNIGAGRVVHQDISLIDQKINDKSFYENTVLLEAVKHAKTNNSNIHLIGLLSKTGIHSHVRHLYCLLNFLKENNFDRVFIDLFSDGRDSDPMSGIVMVDEVESEIKKIGVGRISSISGRFFAMDRDNRWGRISRAYNLLVCGEGNSFPSAGAAFSKAYAEGQTDEFIEPRLIANEFHEKSLIKNNDAVIFFNFRSDRSKELVEAFLADRLPQFLDRRKLSNLYFASFTIYEENQLSRKVFQPEVITNPLAKAWSLQGLRQFHTAETEKYPHVTYFINGGTEKAFPGEDRLMIPSPKDIKTYDYKPKMSAGLVTSNLISRISKKIHDTFIVNFANTDMVGHTGNFEATVQAAEFVDECLGRIARIIQNFGGTMIVLADHGNAEQMVNPHTGYPDTEHTTNPVPFIIFSEEPNIKNMKLSSDGILASVSPTVLDLMHIAKPVEMTNQSLVIKEELIK